MEEKREDGDRGAKGGLTPTVFRFEEKGNGEEEEEEEGYLESKTTCEGDYKR